MKYRWILIPLVLCVTTIMLMSNAFGALGPPPVWLFQATLSLDPANIDDLDPENSGYGPVQVSVWEHDTGIVAPFGDIWFSFSLNDGVAWSIPAAIPTASTAVDERNPAVSVTRPHAVLGQEIHVVYQRDNAGVWEVWHTYMNFGGGGWLGPFPMSTAGRNAIDPAIVYTEDLATIGGAVTFVNQMVWAEEIAAAAGIYQIVYDAHYYDPPAPPPLRGYLGWVIVAPPGAGIDQHLPEIASVEDNFNFLANDYYSAIVWQETNAAGQNNILYVDGTSSTRPLVTFAPTPGSLGQINPVVPVGTNHNEPDIAATQAYLAVDTYYFHVIYSTIVFAVPPVYTIESHWSFGVVPTPGSAAFVIVVPSARGVPVGIILDKPTVASKLIAQVLPITFESWFAWEDSSIPGSMPDIWFSMGQNIGGGGFAYLGGPGRVPYAPLGAADNEFNPEMWNRNDALRLFPLFTHLVFDRTPHPVTGTQEIEYIDP